MLLLTATTDKIQVISSTAATLDVHTSYIDISNAVPPVVQGDTAGRTNTAISSATTTDIVPAPGSNDIRNVKAINIRNKSASTNSTVTVQFNQNSTLFELHKVTLYPGDLLQFVEGVGFFTISTNTGPLKNYNTSSQTPFSSDTYLAGSNITMPAGTPLVGTTYHLIFDVAKTAAGTATPIVTVRYGTAGAIGDTARVTFTFSAGTAATDVGKFEVFALFRTVGSGTSAVLQGNCSLDSQPTTGISSLIHDVQTTSGGFDSTVAASIIGTSYNGGASAAHTVQLVRAELIV